MISRQEHALTPSFSRLTRLVDDLMYLILASISKLTLQPEIAILMYHSVDSTNDLYAVSPREFRRQIEYLRKNYAIVSLDEVVDFVKKRRNLPAKAVVITFDDGYHDFYSRVYPYFQKGKLPATVFVTTGYVGKEWPLSNFHPKMLTWNQIEEISQNNIEIGAHTVTHPILQKISPNEVESELQMSKREIEKHTKKTVHYFSYPFGRYTPEIVDIARSLGFKGGLGGTGTIQKDTQVFLLNRIQVDSSVSFMLFKTRLTKATDWIKRFRHIMKKILGKSPARTLFIFE